MSKSEEKNKPTHSLISNVGYLYRLHWKYSKASLILLVFGIPISLGLSFCGIYMPKVVVEQVISKHAFAIAIIPIISVGFVILILNVCNQIFSIMNRALSMKFRDAVI